MKLHIKNTVTGVWDALVKGVLTKAASISICFASDQLGAAAKAASLPVTMATDQPAIAVKKIGEYETVAAGQTDQVLGATGAAGDYLDRLIIVPATTSPGVIQIKDGGGSAITIFTGGASSVGNLTAFTIELGLVSLAGAWKVTTGANVSALACGDFT